jgi:hypothetical protein
MKFLLRMEQGRLVDAFSSREMKRLTYMTERRIRYASSPALSDAAVYFKSGSLYKCAPGSTCRKYRGTVINFMSSVAIVESPAGSRRLYYLVALMSNVLGKNSARPWTTRRSPPGSTASSKTAIRYGHLRRHHDPSERADEAGHPLTARPIRGHRDSNRGQLHDASV